MTEIPSVLRSALWLDVEASGFGPDSYPIEVGWATFEGETESVLIKPAPGWAYWDTGAQAVHGIAPERLQAEGFAVDAVIARIAATTAGRLVLSDNPDFDRWWLGRLFAEADIPVPFTIEDSASFACAVGSRFGASDMDWERAERLAGRQAPITHRAADDARHWAVLTRLLAFRE
jgi:DNA polymerase III epsilon subunit-like protein